MVIDKTLTVAAPIVQVVGISDMKISINPNDILITHSLGSCVGVTIYDPDRCIGAMIHCMLPLAKMNAERAQEKPFMFVDSGVPIMIQEFLKRGANKKRLIVKVAGAGSFLDQNKFFNIGERNYTALRKILWMNEIMITKEDVGGTVPRTLSLYMKTGVTTIKTAGKETVL